jgi:hypothetical protein
VIRIPRARLHREGYFTVSFLHPDEAAAQKLRDEWNPNEDAMDEGAPAENYAMAAMAH